MRPAPALIAAALALTLPACSSPEEPAAQPSEATTPAEAAPEPAATTATADAATIPLAMHGRWGLVPADCTSRRGDTKGLLTIDGDRLTFYESVGSLAAVGDSQPDRLRATFAMNGEGMEWQREMLLTLTDAGKTLIRQEFGADAVPQPLRYQRCTNTEDA